MLRNTSRIIYCPSLINLILGWLQGKEGKVNDQVAAWVSSSLERGIFTSIIIPEQTNHWCLTKILGKNIALRVWWPNRCNSDIVPWRWTSISPAAYLQGRIILSVSFCWTPTLLLQLITQILSVHWWDICYDWLALTLKVWQCETVMVGLWSILPKQNTARLSTFRPAVHIRDNPYFQCI